VFWTDCFPPDLGGVEVLSEALLHSLAQRGHHFCVISSPRDPSAPALPRDSGRIVQHRLPLRQALAERDLGRIHALTLHARRLIGEFSPELVHTPVVGPSLFVLRRALRGSSPPLLLSLQQADAWTESDRAGTLVAEVLGAASRVACCSEWMRRRALELFPRIAGKASVVRNALPVPELSPSPLDDTAPHVLCAGRLSVEKGFDLAIRALPALRSRFPDASLTIAGDGAARPQLERLAGDLGLSGSVRFAGWVPPQRIPELINTACAVVVPSRLEAFGLTALQAALMGRPVVASRVGGLAEVVIHGVSGLLVAPESPEEITRALVDLLEQPGRAAAMGAAARRAATERFVWRDHVDAYEALYQQLALD
jgi:glycogen(starch) synthase